MDAVADRRSLRRLVYIPVVVNSRARGTTDEVIVSTIANGTNGQEWMGAVTPGCRDRAVTA